MASREWKRREDRKEQKQREKWREKAEKEQGTQGAEADLNNPYAPGTRWGAGNSGQKSEVAILTPCSWRGTCREADPQKGTYLDLLGKLARG